MRSLKSLKTLPEFHGYAYEMEHPARIAQLLEQWLHLVIVIIKPSQTPAHFPYQDKQQKQHKHTHTVGMQGSECKFFFFFKQRNKRITANVYVVWHCQFSYCVWTCSGTDELLLVYFSPLFLQIKKETKKRHQTVIRAWRDISTTMQAPSWIKNWCNNKKELNCDLTVCINCWTCYWMFI